MTKQTQKEQAAVEAASEVTVAEVKEALYKIRAEELPATPEEKEIYFMAQVQAGDKLVQQGACSCVSARGQSVDIPRSYPQVACFT